VWWHTPLIPALGRQRQADFWVRGQPGLQSEFQTARATQRNPVLKKKKSMWLFGCLNVSVYHVWSRVHRSERRYCIPWIRISCRGWWDGSVGKSTRLLFWRSRVQIPATTWWLTTIRNEIWLPLLVCLKTATVHLHIINKYIFKKKKEFHVELLCGCWELSLGPLQEQPVLLTT
jgi:hypothetical protein